MVPSALLNQHASLRRYVIASAPGRRPRQFDRLRARTPALGGRHPHAHAGMRRSLLVHDRVGLRLRFGPRTERHSRSLAGSRTGGVGIGFLGAGAILARGEIVKGLTTAASIWTVAAIGLAAGGGLYFAAAISTAVILAILAGVKPLEELYRERNQSCRLIIEATHGALTPSWSKRPSVSARAKSRGSW